jgi:ABC-type antimicrobial peptide transport system permease subunit
MKVQPPKRALRFLRWFCREDYLEEFEGDLIELFEKHHEISPQRAKRKFFWGVMRCFRPGFMKAFYKVNYSNTVAMFLHNITLAFRGFRKYRGSFAINLLGLSTGLACFILISLWVRDELQVDQFLREGDRVFQVLQNVDGPGGIRTMEATPIPLAEAIKSEIPEVEFVARTIPTSFNVSKGVISFRETRLKAVAQYASPDFLRVFQYPTLSGGENALSRKNGVVISERLAKNLFTEVESALGQTLSWQTQNMEGTFLITAVLRELPPNATSHFDLLLSFDWFADHNDLGGWSNNSPRTFVKLRKGVNKERFDAKIKDFLKNRAANSSATLFAQKYADRYLYGTYENGKSVGGRIEYVVLLTTIAVFILIIACINFMNLSTARASRRTKEVGVKKALGAGRKDLIFQYLQESLIMSFLSLAVALLAVFLLLPVFNEIVGKHIQLQFSGRLIALALTATLFTGLVSGSYPAFYLSRFNPVKDLNGAVKSSGFEVLFRKALVVFQFAISVILIIVVLVVNRQLVFIQDSKTAGYDRDQVIYFGVENMSQAFFTAIRDVPGVVSAGAGGLISGNPLGGTDDVHWKGREAEQRTFFSTFWTGYYLAETLNMELVQGDYFSEDLGSSLQVMLNEKAVEEMGLDNPIGITLTLNGSERKVVGVLKNFHFESLYEEVKPCILLLAPINFAPRISVKIQAGIQKTVINRVKEVYEEYNPGLVFDFKFMDEDYERLYASENRIAVLSKYFTVFAIIISCLGLFGMAAFMLERRMKEISIRKVLGASHMEIVKLLNRDYMKLIGLTLVIALPTGYLVTSNWLSGFAYSIEPGWWYFLLAGAGLVIITGLTVSFQTIRAGRANPVKYLKSE